METQLQRAIRLAENWQHAGNVAADRGQQEKAEECYAKSQKWRDRMNRLLGNGDGSEA